MQYMMELMQLCYQENQLLATYPVETVAIMNKIIESVEIDKDNFDLSNHEKLS